MIRLHWIRTARRASVLLAVVASAACATKRDVRDLQTEIRQLSQRQDALLTELQQFGAITQDTLRSTAQELFNMRGDVVRQLNLMSEQLDRLTELVGQNSIAIQQMRDSMDQIRRAATQGGLTMSGGGSPAGGGSQEAGSRTNGGDQADAAYQTAMNLFNRGSNTAASAAFRDFLEQYPRDELAPKAHFRLADILQQQGDSEAALAEFAKIGEEFPNDPEVPNAMYRMARIHVDEGRESNARDILRRLINTWPDAPAAPVARDLLEDIGGV